MTRLRDWLLESFWIADVLAVAMIAFFVVVGGSASTPLLVAGLVLAVLYAAHLVWRRRHAGGSLSPADRRTRERRGF